MNTANSFNSEDSSSRDNEDPNLEKYLLKNAFSLPPISSSENTSDSKKPIHLVEVELLRDPKTDEVGFVSKRKAAEIHAERAKLAEWFQSFQRFDTHTTNDLKRVRILALLEAKENPSLINILLHIYLEYFTQEHDRFRLEPKDTEKEHHSLLKRVTEDPDSVLDMTPSEIAAEIDGAIGEYNLDEKTRKRIQLAAANCLSTESIDYFRALLFKAIQNIFSDKVNDINKREMAKLALEIEDKKTFEPPREYGYEEEEEEEEDKERAEDGIPEINMEILKRLLGDKAKKFANPESEEYQSSWKGTQDEMRKATVPKSERELTSSLYEEDQKPEDSATPALFSDASIAAFMESLNSETVNNDTDSKFNSLDLSDPFAEEETAEGREEDDDDYESYGKRTG